jgi:hypothetical protein
MLQRPFRAPSVAVVLFALAGFASAPADAKDPFRRGEKVVITGQAVDPSGQPMGGVDVVLVAAKSKIGLGSFKRVEEGEARVAAHTDENGGFRFDWTWDPYYNTFHLLAVIELRAEGGRLVQHQVGLLELDERMEQGSPVVGTLEITRPNFLRQGQAFLTSLTTDDLETTYEQMGKPDRVDRLELAHGEEVSWWYFESGKSFHFVGGRIEETAEFEPVLPF